MLNFLLVLTAVVAPMLTGSRAAVISNRDCTVVQHTGRLRLWQPFTPGGPLQATNAHVYGGLSNGDFFVWNTPLTGDTFTFPGCPDGPYFELTCTTCDGGNAWVAVYSATDNGDYMLWNAGAPSPLAAPVSASWASWYYDGTFITPVLPTAAYYATSDDEAHLIFSPDATSSFPYFALGWEELS